MIKTTGSSGYRGSLSYNLAQNVFRQNQRVSAIDFIRPEASNAREPDV